MYTLSKMRAVWQIQFEEAGTNIYPLNIERTNWVVSVIYNKWHPCWAIHSGSMLKEKSHSTPHIAHGQPLSSIVQIYLVTQNPVAKVFVCRNEYIFNVLACIWYLHRKWNELNKNLLMEVFICLYQIVKNVQKCRKRPLKSHANLKASTF